MKHKKRDPHEYAPNDYPVYRIDDIEDLPESVVSTVETFDDQKPHLIISKELMMVYSQEVLEFAQLINQPICVASEDGIQQYVPSSSLDPIAKAEFKQFLKEKERLAKELSSDNTPQKNDEKEGK